MEEMQGSRFARRTSNGEARSACGRGARLTSSNGSRIDDYVEIFRGFAASCSIPVLVLPEAMNGCEEELAGSQTCGLNYLDIFGALDAGSFTLACEDLLSLEKVSKEEGEEDSSFQEETDVGHVVIGASEFVGPELPGMHITFSEVNPISANCHSVFETEQLKFSVGSNQLNTEDEVNSTVCICKPQAICKHNIEAETTFPTGFVENNSLRKVTGDEHFLNGYIGKEKQSQKLTKEILDRCFVSTTVEASENDLKEAHKLFLKDTTCDLKQHSRSSSYHSTSSWDIPFSDHAFLTISDINLRTQPLEVPPPSRAPPKLDMKPEMSKSETLEASTITFNKNNQELHVGGALICHALKGTLNNTSIHSNTEMDAGRTAAASSAAMLEAMELAQARLKSAKELMERKRESDRRLGHHDFFIRNGQNYTCTEDSVNKAKKEHMKFSNQEERVASALSEDCGEAVQGKDSRSYKLSAEKEMSQHWKVDKQFFELVSSEMFVRANAINQGKFNNNEDIKLTHQHDAYPYFPKKESLVNHEHMFLQNGDAKEGENVVRNLNKFRINEMKLPSVGELQLQDVSAKNLKSGILIEKEIINIFETSSYGGDEGRAKTGEALQVPDINTEKLVDTFFVLQQDGNENEPKNCQESLQCSDGEINTESDTKPNIACGMMNGSVSIDFCRDSNHAEFDSSEASEKMMEQDKEIKTFTSEVEEISGASVVFEYDTFRSNECMTMNNGKVTSECGFYVKLKGDQASSLKNEIDEEVDIENWISCSGEKDKNLKSNREESQPSRQTIKETCTSYNDGKNSDLFCFDNTFGQGTGTNRDINKTNEPEKKQRAKWNIPNKSELDAAKFLFHPVCSATAKESLKFLHSEEVNVFELPQKLENSDDRASVVREEIKDEKNILGKVQAALELEKTIMGFGVRIKDSEAVQQACSLNINGKNMNPSVDTSRSSLKQMEKRMPGVRRSVNNRNKESFCGERMHEVEQKRKLEEEKEREREREKDMNAVGKATQEGCERVFAETRERPEIVMGERVSSETLSSPIKAYRDIAERPLSEVFERSQKIAFEAKLRSERAAVERATMEARERAIERALAEQSLLAARKHTETSVNASNDKNLKSNETEGNVKQGDNGSVDNHKPASVLHDTSTDMNSSQTEDREGESPLRCKARQERCRRIVERAAKALAEKNMRDLVAQREQAERNRLAEPLDADVRRWSSGKEGNLRALLSTLQYILGHDSGWQPIPLTEVITAAAVKKAYRKATLYLHPDKLQQRGASIQQKYICEKVFDLLKDAWNKYNSERW